MVKLNGRNLTIEKIIRIVEMNDQVTLDQRVAKKVKRSSDFVIKIIRSKKAVYGLNTGFGALSLVRIPEAQLAALQKNLLLSHNAGVGEFVPPAIVKTAMLLRLNTLIQGHSGVQPDTVRTILKLINRDIIPMVPSKGSVGASGDLAPLAAMALALIGEGEVLYKNRKQPARKALRSAGIRESRLNPKEGLALVNGTQLMTAYGVALLSQIDKLVDLFDLAGTMSLEALCGTDRAFDKRISKLRPYPGQQKTASNLRRFLAGSKILRSHRNCLKVQDAYSLRCIPQVHGAVRDIFTFVRKQIEIEINSVTDNPLLFPETNEVLLGGNFHGEPVAIGLDLLTIGLAELSSIAERRIFRLLDPQLSGLEPFLIKNPGINSGYMMLQTTAAALVAQNKILAHPASVDSIPTSANQEDHVSMGMNAALKAFETLDNTKTVLALELLCATQGIDLRRPLQSSRFIEKVIKLIRRHVPYLKKDRDVSIDIKKTINLVNSGKISDLISR